jgi:Fic family protein
VFYFASFIHLKFVHIHPFNDWNWRAGRLLEKWFLTSKLWIDFWKLESEKFYKENRENYYKNINLWVNYYEINYDNSLNFLLMLTKSL